jgi:hypothetical protein
MSPLVPYAILAPNLSSVQPRCLEFLIFCSKHKKQTSDALECIVSLYRSNFIVSKFHWYLRSGIKIFVLRAAGRSLQTIFTKLQL